MLIERQIAPALLLLGGALVMPGALSALRGGDFPISAGTMVVGDLLGAAGLFVDTLLVRERALASKWHIPALILLCFLALLFSAGTIATAVKTSGMRAFFLGLAAFVPLLSFYGAFRE